MCKEMNKIEFEKFQNEMARLSQIKYTSYLHKVNAQSAI